MRDPSQGLLMAGGVDILAWKSSIWTELLMISLKQEWDCKQWGGVEGISESHV